MARTGYDRGITFLLLAGVFILSIFVVVLFWAVLPGTFRINESPDYIFFYEPVARNLLAGRGLIDTDGAIAIRYPPGYPIILAGIFGLSELLNIPEGTVLSAVILLCMGLTSIFVFLLAKGMWGRFPALISPLIWITYPGALWLTKQPNSEIPFLVFFYSSFCLLWHGLHCRRCFWVFCFVSGLLLGFAMLIRPIAIGAGVVMVAIVWLIAPQIRVGFKLSLITMLLLGSSLVIFPWEVWVYSKTGRVVPVSTAGTPSLRDGLTFAVAPKSWRKGVEIPQDVKALMKDVYAHYDQLQSFGEITSFMSKKLQKNPVTVAKLFLIKATRSWYGTDSQRYETTIQVIQAAYLILILGATIAIWSKGGFAPKLTLGIWLMVLYFWGMATLTLSIVRYIIPVMGLLFVLIPGLFFKPSVKKLTTSGC